MGTMGRRVVLGISGPNAARLVDWAALLVQPGDTVHIVYASELEAAIRLAGSSLRRHRADIAVFESSSFGPVALREAASGADLIILAAPHLDRDRAALVRLLAEVECPVFLAAPTRPAPVRSVTVILRGDQDNDPLLEVAFAQARRFHCGVLAIEPWQPSPEDGRYYAETAEQKELDGYLAGWQERFADVGVAAELWVGNLAQVIKECASGADLLILPVRRPSSDLLDPELDAVLTERSHPTVLIPEPHPTREPEHDLTPDRVGGRLG